MINRIMLLALAILRRTLQNKPRFLALLGAPVFQPLLTWIGQVEAWEGYLKANRDLPAYMQFASDLPAPAINPAKDLSRLPPTTKENYVTKYSLEDRCYGGRIPSKGVVIDESSGSSGIPNNWVRGPAERNSVKAIIQL